MNNQNDKEDDNPEAGLPVWLFHDTTELDRGSIVKKARLKARQNVAVREVIELYVGNIFTVFLVLLAPVMKLFVEQAMSNNSTNSGEE